MVADHERPTPRPHLARRRQARLLVYASQTRLASTRLERTFDPAFIQRLKDAATADISIGGPHLAADAIRAGLVDEYWMLIWRCRASRRKSCECPG